MKAKKKKNPTAVGLQFRCGEQTDGRRRTEVGQVSKTDCFVGYGWPVGTGNNNKSFEEGRHCNCSTSESTHIPASRVRRRKVCPTWETTTTNSTASASGRNNQQQFDKQQRATYGGQRRRLSQAAQLAHAHTSGQHSERQEASEFRGRADNGGRHHGRSGTARQQQQQHRSASKKLNAGSSTKQQGWRVLVIGRVRTAPHHSLKLSTL